MYIRRAGIGKVCDVNIEFGFYLNERIEIFSLYNQNIEHVMLECNNDYRLNF